MTSSGLSARNWRSPPAGIVLAGIVLAGIVLAGIVPAENIAA
jgi:hypothetical protein